MFEEEGKSGCDSRALLVGRARAGHSCAMRLAFTASNRAAAGRVVLRGTHARGCSNRVARASAASSGKCRRASAASSSGFERETVSGHGHGRTKPQLVLLDRDGVINEDVGSPGVTAVEQLRLVPGSAQAVAALKQAG